MGRWVFFDWFRKSVFLDKEDKKCVRRCETRKFGEEESRFMRIIEVDTNLCADWLTILIWVTAKRVKKRTSRDVWTPVIPYWGWG